MQSEEFNFFKFSYDEHSHELLKSDFTQKMKEFDKNSVNEETLELLEPFFALKSETYGHDLICWKIARRASYL
jgi:hypothetical protein